MNYAAPRSGSNGAVRIPSAPHAPVVVGQGPARYARIVSAGPPLSHFRHPDNTPGLGISLGTPRMLPESNHGDPPHSTSQAQAQQLDAVQAVHRDGWALLLKDYTLPQLTQICHLL